MSAPVLTSHSSMSLPPPAYNNNPKSFAYSTARTRWPTIIKGAISELQDHATLVPASKDCAEAVIAKIQTLLEALESDAAILPFLDADVATYPFLRVYNEQLVQYSRDEVVSWHNAPWLWSECYMYQLLNLWFQQTQKLGIFDVFGRLKSRAFQQSSFGVLELCKRYEVLGKQLAAGSADKDAQRLLFVEFAVISLWGNASDLSLFAGNVTLEDIKSMQGAKVRKKNEEKILVNDIEEAWRQIEGCPGARVDFVLDNSGFELFSDLCMSLFMLDSGLAKIIVLHCKEMPWFVSDTMPKDFDELLQQLEDPAFFSDIRKEPADRQSIQYVVARLKHYVSSGQISTQHHPFWTSCEAFWSIPHVSDLYIELKKSDLIIFKGDLNYRKLTADLDWDSTTPFTNAIQELASLQLPILALRTCKSDVVVGLPAGVNEELIKTYKEMGNEIGELWRPSGKWGVISFCPGN